VFTNDNLGTTGEHPSVKVTSITYKISNKGDDLYSRVEVFWYDNDDEESVKNKVRASYKLKVSAGGIASKTLTSFSGSYLSSISKQEIFVLKLYDDKTGKLLDIVTVTFEAPEAAQKDVNLISENAFTDFLLETKINYKKPFYLSNNQIYFDIKLKESSDIQQVKITDIKVLTENYQLLGEATGLPYDYAPLSDVGDQMVFIPIILSSYTSTSGEQNLKVRVEYEVTRSGGSIVKDSYEITIGIEIIK